MATPAGDTTGGGEAGSGSQATRGGNRNSRGGGRSRGRRDGQSRGGGGGGGGGSSRSGQRRGGRGGGGGGGDGTAGKRPTTADSASGGQARDGALDQAKQKLPSASQPAAEGAEDDDAEGEVCFICANPIQHYSIAPCNHITCHICSLRMRALYKNKDCPHCRTPAPYVIFTDDASKRYDEYGNADTTSTDDNIGIKYTNEDIVGDTVLLLRYNCPDESCDYAGLGWPDLHRHVRSVHHKKMCDLCTRNKKVFTHEHELFTDKALERHMRHGDHQPGAVDQTGFKGHPLCGFCGERFYDDDKLYEHCRNKHERCFLCDRRDSRQPHYYRDYNALEQHFKKDHFICLDRECLEKKFVVFESEMDLKAHQLSEHGNSLSKDVRRDARVVDMSSFDYRPTYQQEHRGGGGRGRREGQSSRGRDPNSEALPPSSAQPMRRDEIAFQRQMAIHSAQSVTSRTFGGQLSSSASAAQRPNASTQATSSSSSAVPSIPLADAMESLNVTDAENLPPQERARLMRHGAVVERAANLLGKDAAKMTTFRSHISSYRTGALTAPQLIDAFFALFAETSSTGLGTLVREVADLFEDKGKADALRKAWQDWRAINEDYPSLPGLGGMHGATTADSGWAGAVSGGQQVAGAAAGGQNQSKHTTRVLKLKSSTTRRGSASASSGPVPVVAGSRPAASWVSANKLSSNPRAPPTTASSAFPALPGASASSRGATAATTGPSASWYGGVSGSGASTPSRSGTPAAAAAAASARRPPGQGEDAFPALPAAPKVQTTIFGYGGGRGVRRDLGGNRDTGFSWGGGGAGGSASGAASEAEGGGDADGGGGGGGKGKKKGKQGKKQVLVQWG
ncbi:uncharacterized protein E0L32_003777 [Thyridium curvatum]|uniref:RING-type E3 ubiquitin transferase n=1 Tax=Thyridium curvatum TaxID=1093900 RepID=A0A507BA47_9PEZI|nr:uncharacterized protein E0L32_003777 [Thyridium curvatum]TPX16483.1 hypothetical protein E0L32_003777 [Thyridium curvatum]